MKIHEIKPLTKKTRKRVGRGYSSGRGSTSGRGHKGERSRAGYKIPPGFEGGQTKIVRRLPKRRGFHNKWKKYHFPVRVAKLEVFADGAKVSLKDLIEQKIVNKSARLVKIVGDGKLKKSLTLVNLPVTNSARKVIEDAGGEVLG